MVVPGDAGVKAVYRKSGPGLAKEWRESNRDPAIPYRITDKGSRPLMLQADKALWRDSSALLAHTMDFGAGDPVYRKVLTRLGPRPAIVALSVMADSNRIDLWRDEGLPVPSMYFQDGNEPALARLQSAIGLADHVAGLPP